MLMLWTIWHAQVGSGVVRVRGRGSSWTRVIEWLLLSECKIEWASEWEGSTINSIQIYICCFRFYSHTDLGVIMLNLLSIISLLYPLLYEMQLKMCTFLLSHPCFFIPVLYPLRPFLFLCRKTAQNNIGRSWNTKCRRSSCGYFQKSCSPASCSQKGQRRR